MCTVSMIMDARFDDWQRRQQDTGIGTYKLYPLGPATAHTPVPPVVTPQEIDEFRRLLERAREYDRKHNEPDCELEEKRQRIKDLAEKLGVKVEFV